MGAVARLQGWLEGRRAGTSAFAGFSDALGYQALVADGVALLKDRFAADGGALLGGFWYRGPDLESASGEALETLSSAVNSALKKLDAGWMVHVEAIRVAVHQYEAGEFTEPVDRLLDEERGERAVHYVTEYALFATHAPTRLGRSVERGMKSLVLGESPEQELVELAGRLDAFEAHMAELERSLGQALDVRRMRTREGNDELLSALNLVVNGRLQWCRPPRNAQHLDCLLARDLVGRRGTAELWYDGLCVEVVGVLDLPASSAPAMMHALTQLGIELRWSSRFIVFDYGGARGRLKALEGKWESKVVPLTAQVLGTVGRADRDAVERVDEVQEALADLESGAVRFGHYTTVVVVRGQDAPQARERANLVVQALEENGFSAVVERANRQEAFLGSLPGHGVQNVRKPMIHSLNFADMMPLGREWEGQRTCPSPMFPAGSPALLQARSWSGSAFHLNLHKDDVGHALVIGPTGAGKSTLLATLASQWMRYPRSQVFAFDQGGSLTALTLARGDGVFYRLGAEGGPELCPLAELEGHGDREWAAGWIETLCEAQGLVADPSRRLRIREAVAELAEETLVLGPAQRAGARTLTHLVPHFVDGALATALSYYTTGPGMVLNGANDSLRHARLTTFELEELLDSDARVVAPTLMYLFRQVEKRLDGRPTLLIIDEAWAQLRDPVFVVRLRAWLKKLRKRNCAVVLATQQLSDVANSELSDVVFESCPTRILLPNDLATGSMRRLYEECLGLTSVQVELLARIERKRWYLFAQGSRSRLFTLDLGPAALAFCGAGSPAELSSIWGLLQAQGERWPEAWLRARGLPGEAERLDALRGALS